MTLRILIYQRDDYDKMFIRADGIQDELGKSTDDGVKFRVAVQFSVQIFRIRLPTATKPYLIFLQIRKFSMEQSDKINIGHFVRRVICDINRNIYMDKMNRSSGYIGGYEKMIKRKFHG